jgi:hypothetical protein
MFSRYSANFAEATRTKPFAIEWHYQNNQEAPMRINNHDDGFEMRDVNDDKFTGFENVKVMVLAIWAILLLAFLFISCASGR